MAKVIMLAAGQEWLFSKCQTLQLCPCSGMTLVVARLVLVEGLVHSQTAP